MVHFCVRVWLQKTSVQWQTWGGKRKKKRLTLSSCKRPTRTEASSTFALLAAHLPPCHTIGCWPRGGGHLKSQWYQNESFVTFSTFKSVKIHFHQIRSTRSGFLSNQILLEWEWLHPKSHTSLPKQFMKKYYVWIDSTHKTVGEKYPDDFQWDSKVCI